MDNFVDRLNEIYIHFCKHSYADMARKMQLTSVAVPNYLKGERCPDTKALINLLNALPNISAEWLLRGYGSMYKDANEAINQISMDNVGSHNNQVAGDQIMIGTDNVKMTYLAEENKRLVEENAELKALNKRLLDKILK